MIFPLQQNVPDSTFDAYEITKLGADGPINRFEGKDGTLYTKRFSEVNGGKGAGAALSYQNDARFPNKLIVGKNDIQTFYNDGVAIKKPRFGKSGYFCVVGKGGNHLLYGYMNEAGDISTLSGMDKSALESQGQTSKKAIGRLMKKVGKFFENHPPKLR